MLLESSVMLLELSIMLLESSIMLLIFFNTGHRFNPLKPSILISSALSSVPLPLAGQNNNFLSPPPPLSKLSTPPILEMLSKPKKVFSVSTL
jgi:hypothetical protein